MNRDVKDLLAAVENCDFSVAFERCERLVSLCMTEFMEQLTVNTATDYVGSVILYSDICASEKKPWKAIPKLEAARGALRFLEDYMEDQATLAEAFRSVAASFAYAGFLPEAALFFQKEARCCQDIDELKDAVYSALFYEARFGKDLPLDFDFVKEKIGEGALTSLKERALLEARDQIRLDPIESSEEYLKIRFDVEKEVDDILSEIDSSDLPFCLRYWTAKKRVLKDTFGIDWRTPEEMNPEIRFY